MKILKNSLYLYVRSASLLVGLVALLAAPHVLILPVIKDTLEMVPIEVIDIFRFIDPVFRISCVTFLLACFISFEYMRKLRDAEIDETIRAGKNGLFRVWAAQAGVLLSIVALSTLNSISYIFYGAFRFGPADGGLMANLLLGALLYFLLPGVIAILLGSVLAFGGNRFLAYGLMALWGYIGSNFFVNPIALLGLRLKNNLLYWLRDAFYITYPMDSPINYTYGVPVEWYRFSLALFWILFLGVLLTFCWRTKKAWKRYLAGGLALACAVGAVLRPGFRPLDYRIDGIRTSDYYTMHAGREEQVAYTAESYTMQLNIGLGLKAETTVSLSGAGGEKKLLFTLDHAFRISEIADEAGNSLSFSQNGDYVEVTAPSGAQKLTFSYRGTSGEFYSNMQGAYLPAASYFFPVPGWVYLARENTNFNVGDRIHRTQLAAPANFVLKIDAPGYPLFVSLPRTKDGTYSGSTDGVTILGGYYEQVEEAGIQMVRPLYPTEYRRGPDDEFLETVDYLGEKLGVPILEKFYEKPIMLCDLTRSGGGMQESSLIEAQDHILARCVPIGKTAAYETVKMLAGRSPEKREVAFLTYMYLYEPTKQELQRIVKDSEKGLETWDKNVYHVDEVLPFMQAMDERGEDEAFREIGRYLTDPADQRTAKEFLEAL